MIHHLVAAVPNGCPIQTSSGSGGILGPIAKPIASVLAAFYSVIPNYGVAILILSVVWMIIISPLTLKTTRSMLAMQKLQPQLKKLHEQHKNDRQAFAAAQMELFKEHNVSPFGACLPSILPLPVFFALFRVIDGLSHTSTKTINGVKTVCSTPKYLSAHTHMFKDIVAAGGHINAFGMDLSKNALDGHSSFLAAAPFFLLLLIMIGTQYLQTAQMMSRNPAAADNPQAKLMKFIPLVFGVICIRFPAGVVLYYGMSNVCRIVQQSAMYRFDPKVRALVARDVIEVEAHTNEIDAKSKGKAAPKPVAGKAAPSTPPSAKSRFQKLVENAQNQREAAQSAKGGNAKPSTKALGSGNQAKKANGAKPNAAKPNGAKAGQPPKPNAAKPNGAKLSQPAKSASSPVKGNGANGANGANGGANGGGNGGGNGANGANGGGNGANGGGQSPAATNPLKNGNPNAKPRTGAGGGRTGARSGANRKRRGR